MNDILPLRLRRDDLHLLGAALSCACAIRVVHEWAHGCGWSHGKSNGVPLDSGRDRRR